METYIVECRSCKGEIVIDRPSDETLATAFNGTFHTFPDCPHCGDRHFYDSSDIKMRQESPRAA